MKLFVVVVLVFSAVFAGGGVIVAQANAAAPGDLLYNVDRGIENLRLDLVSSPQAALELQAQFALERLQEVRALNARGEQAQAGALFAEVSEQLETLESAAQANASGQSVADLLNQAYGTDSPLALDVNDNDNENGNENENANLNGNENANGNENSNENANGNENVNGNENGNENANGNANSNGTFKQPKSGGFCNGSAGKHHPKGDALAAEFSASYDDVMGYFCQGYGFGEIALAYQLSQQAGVPVGEVFAQRGSGQGWGQVMKSYGLHGKSGKTGGQGNGQGGNNGQGNGKGNGKGNSDGGPGNHGNGKGNGGNGKGNGNGNGKGKKP